VTVGAEDAASAVPPVASAAALLIETCATMAAQAARRGDLGAVRYLLEHALPAIGATRDS
jgi:hypothetical protein